MSYSYCQHVYLTLYPQAETYVMLCYVIVIVIMFSRQTCVVE
jgi:hypothetical protein